MFWWGITAHQNQARCPQGNLSHDQPLRTPAAHSEVVKAGKEKKVIKTQGIIGTGVVVVHACNSSTKKAEAELSRVQTSLGYKVSHHAP